MALWDQIAVQISGEGECYSGDFAKKRWLKIRDQYRKELNFAIRDNFAYTPKWPYFKRLEWLSDFVKDGRFVSIRGFKDLLFALIGSSYQEFLA